MGNTWTSFSSTHTHRAQQGKWAGMASWEFWDAALILILSGCDVLMLLWLWGHLIGEYHTNYKWFSPIRMLLLDRMKTLRPRETWLTGYYFKIDLFAGKPIFHVISAHIAIYLTAWIEALIKEVMSNLWSLWENDVASWIFIKINDFKTNIGAALRQVNATIAL